MLAWLWECPKCSLRRIVRANEASEALSLAKQDHASRRPFQRETDQRGRFIAKHGPACQSSELVVMLNTPWARHERVQHRREGANPLRSGRTEAA